MMPKTVSYLLPKKEINEVVKSQKEEKYLDVLSHHSELFLNTAQNYNRFMTYLLLFINCFIQRDVRCWKAPVHPESFPRKNFR